MKIDLENLTSGTQHLSGREVVRFEDVNGNDNTIDCQVDLTVRKTSEAIYVHAELRGELTTPCHKCLEPAKCHVEPSFDVVFRKTGSASEAGEATGDEDLVFVSPDDSQVSLDGQIYENLIVSLPIRILCKEECRGLCSRCGANLNLEECACAADTDPRWDALRKLKDDMTGK